MKRRINLLVVLLVALGSIASSRAQIVTYTWTGAASSNYWNEMGNWLNGVTPLEDVVNTRVIFGNVPKTYVSYSEIYVNQLTFSGNTRPYYLQGYADTTHLGAGGIVYSPGAAVHSALAGSVQLEASQTWNIANGTFEIEDGIGDYYTNESFSYVSHDYQITKTGAGTLVLGNYSNNYWGGGLVLSQGKVVINSGYDSYSDPVGTGTLTFNGGTLVTRSDYYDDYPVYLENNVVSNGLISTQNETELHIGYSGEGNSTIELTANTTIQSNGQPLFLEGNIIQTGGEAGTPRSLNVTGSGAVVLTGSNSYTGGTTATNGVLIFGNAYAIPSNNLDSSSVGHLTAGTNGYIGFGDSSYTNSVQSYFLNDFNKAVTIGTIGLDTDPELSTPNIFTDSIDLSAVPTGTAFGATARLGSATSAILTGTITPQGSEYRFGGGGGWLQVDSQLTGTRALVVDSPAAMPLTLRLTYTGNNYTGGTSVTNSALIFGSSGGSGTFPSGTRNVTINPGGYVGFEIWGDQSDANFVLNSLLKINTSSVGAVGFDGNGGYYILPNTAPIDLSLFTNALYLGTSTKGVEGPGLTLSGTITPAGGGTAPYRFAGYKGGALEVASTLAGSRAVHIGDPSSPATFGDYLDQTYSKVALTGDNSTLTGPIMLYGGQLMVGQSNVGATTNALGSGTLEVTGMTLPAEWSGNDGEAPTPRLSAVASGLIIPNNINLGTELNVGGDNSFTLAGGISGTGELYVGEDSGSGFTLGLSGNNSFSGGVYVASGATINVGSNTALGTGPLGFGYSGGSINFQTAAPVIGSLMTKDEYDYAYLHASLTNTVLTINQSLDGKFRGEFRSDATYPDDNLRLVKNGAGNLRLDDGGMFFYHGTTEATLAGTPEVSLQVNQGTLVLGNDFYVESSTPTVWVHGGTLALDNAYLYNPIVIDNGGRLAGTGQLNMATIGTGGTLSPGSALGGQIGFMDFSSHLTLAPGGTYEWNLAHNGNFVSDHVNVGSVTTLEITATTANKFTLRAITLGADGNPGILAGAIGPNATYSWMLMSALGITPNGAGFDPNAFTLDVSQFQTDVGTGLALGTFSVSLASGDTLLMLNLTTFAGIPEPSTYALLALGLGLLGLTAWRQRRA
ncbi:MAG: PEP-CTERM sorting domain-containing protein [Lacunisphaera sp.]|nr:PEP-CTERM sorting domain-containing protein [Lacunisphaera sp.]